MIYVFNDEWPYLYPPADEVYTIFFVKIFSGTSAPRILKFGTNIRYDLLYRVRQNQHLLIIFFTCPFFFLCNKFFLIDLPGTSASRISIYHWVRLLVSCKRETAS